MAMRLDPLYPNILLHLAAQAHFSMGQDEIAAGYLVERIARNPNTDASRMLLAASYGHLGRIEEAREAWAGLLEVNPGFSMQQREGVLPYKDARGFPAHPGRPGQGRPAVAAIFDHPLPDRARPARGPKL